MTADIAASPLQRIRADVQGMHAYAVQDSRGMVKLDAMENPFGLQLGRQAERVFHGIELDHAARILDGVGMHALHVGTDALQGGCGDVDSHGCGFSQRVQRKLFCRAAFTTSCTGMSASYWSAFRLSSAW